MPRCKRNTSPAHRRMLKGIALRRKILTAAMGGVCKDCGTKGGRSNKLEFHHLQPRTWVCRDKSRWTRQRLYEEEWEKGLLMLLCAHCNKIRGQPFDPNEVPF